MSVLELKNVCYSYKNQYQEVEALKGIDFTFDTGKIYAIVGTSGSGKTTLLSLMAGLDLPSRGQVLYEGTATSDMKLEKYRREKSAVIYQNFMLFPLLTAAENIMFPMEQRGIPAKTAKAKALALIARVGLPESVQGRYPAMLSGGEQQRVAIARALGMDTKIILADEPTGNLDSANSENIIGILKELAHKDGYCVIVVTHDNEFAAQTDRVLHMSDGKITEENSTPLFTS